MGTDEYIHRQIVEMRDQGIVVLLVSAELDNIISLSERIAVMFCGQIVATMDANKTNRFELGLLRSDVTPQEKDKSPSSFPAP